MKAKILIIEDDENIRKNLVALFSSLEYETSSVITAEAALETIQNDKPDLIICDINLPNMSGFKLKEKLNQEKETFGIPLIFLTARDSYEDLRKGMSLAADDYIFKPYKAQELIKSVELRLTKKEQERKKKKSQNVFIKTNKVIKKVSINNIVLLHSENQYSRIFLTSGKEYVVRRSLTEWGKLLPENFIRVSRFAIINLDKITKLEVLLKERFIYLENIDKKIKLTNPKLLGKIKDKIVS